MTMLSFIIESLIPLMFIRIKDGTNNFLHALYIMNHATI